MATKLTPIVDRVELILAQVQEERECPTCHEPQYPAGGSEKDGVFQEYICINKPCPLYLKAVKVE
jgi:hypothetical protein